MNREEFDELGLYVAGLWPKWMLTADQKEMWFHKLQYFSLHDAKRGMGEAYALSKWKEPTLSEVLATLRTAERRGRPVADSEISNEHIRQVEREQEDEAAMLADWTPEEIENGKAEIIRNEPGMALLESLPSKGVMWTHFLVERYVHQRATTFANGRVTRVNGRPVAVRESLHSPRVISRDAYWAPAEYAGESA